MGSRAGDAVSAGASMTLSRPDVRRLLASEGMRPNRALGQNFVVDPNTVRRIARLSAVGPGNAVVEIGAGLGSLTLALAETGASVTAVEIDRGLVPLLRSVVEPVGARVVHGDALSLDWKDLLSSSPDLSLAPDGSGGPWVLVANLPYNIATPLIAKVLDDVPEVTRLVVMVQREVGERLAATAGDPAYGAVSVKVAYHATASLLGRVSPTVFMPRPKVESVVVGMERRATPAVDPLQVGPKRLFEVVKAGFSQRRKMLRRSLAGVVDPAAFEATGTDPTSRAENLDVSAWGRLAGWRGPITDPLRGENPL
jgi:16S rRNA (adenine1518-N6/adenine1519-N6)-dimethyltransferase